ncbi:MAG TPA: LysR family transcriptional regulator [Pseudonocardiaceae bacterium]|nr:LysR family transcriptional regulator [Pseudonocardiaceae bacterium]
MADSRMLGARLPDLVELELLDAISRLGSVTAAATSLGLTQQAASLRIRAMERKLGVTVLVRSSRGSQLTRAGALVNEWASGLLADARALGAALDSLRTHVRAHLRIASSLTIAEHLLPTWLVRFHEQQARAGLPPTEIELSAINTDSVIARVRNGDADVGYVEGPVPPRDLHARVVAHDELLIVARPDHPWTRRRTPVPVGLLARTPLVSREPGSGSQQSFDEALAAVLPPDAPRAAPALAVSTAAAVRAAVAAGAGPAAISSLAVADDLALGRVRVVPVTGLDLRRSLRAVWRGDPQPPVGPVRELLALAAR